MTTHTAGVGPYSHAGWGATTCAPESSLTIPSDLKNRRRERRMLVRWPVCIETSQGDVLPAHTVDISSLGVLFQSPIRLELPGVVNLQMEWSPDCEIHCVALLKHERAAPGGEWAYGAEFEHFFGTDKEALAEALAILLHREMDSEDPATAGK